MFGLERILSLSPSGASMLWPALCIACLSACSSSRAKRQRAHSARCTSRELRSGPRSSRSTRAVISSWASSQFTLVSILLDAYVILEMLMQEPPAAGKPGANCAYGAGKYFRGFFVREIRHIDQNNRSAKLLRDLSQSIGDLRVEFPGQDMAFRSGVLRRQAPPLIRLLIPRIIH